MDSVVVLSSGGLDSSVLLADQARRCVVYPMYVRTGLAWEDEERAMLDSFIAALSSPNVQPLVEPAMPLASVYGDHWSVTGLDVPGRGEADEAVYLPGRNIALIAPAAIWCATHCVSRIAIGSLGGNPFPDATESFFRSFSSVLSEGLDFTITVEAPFRGLSKSQLIKQYAGLPLHLTLTCMKPRNGIHCGACQKCEERQSAFDSAGIEDGTRYEAAGRNA